MVEKYHISPTTGNPNRCYANTKPCPLGGPGDHYPTKEAARKAFEKEQNSKSSLAGLKKKKPAATVKKATPPAKAKTTVKKAAPKAPPADDDEFYAFNDKDLGELDDSDFNPDEVDDWADEMLNDTKKDPWDDEDDIYDSSRESPDDYANRTNSSFSYSWDR